MCHWHLERAASSNVAGSTMLWSGSKILSPQKMPLAIAYHRLTASLSLLPRTSSSSLTLMVRICGLHDTHDLHDSLRALHTRGVTVYGLPD